ncbi:hypothetical protein [Nocardia inohanensis]|uniref:hypothetical protein n=1 Tax=Nocardia inohanensis TaxID=209246 RepID=UPI00082CCBDA|nr:hypothetical protein [Nocardia inohanensis]
MGTKIDVLVIGKATPSESVTAIGAGGNLLMAKSGIKATRIAMETALSDPDASADYRIVHIPD